jgi:hypothetical protein
VADLSGANLTQADLRGANLGVAKLLRANLGETDLGGATLGEADLTEADLSKADLGGANLNGANLTKADLTEASVGWTLFTDVDLGVARELETVHHRGPSSIGIDTIYKSGGKIPDIFLRGAGIPDNFISYIGSLVSKPIEFYSCFISYSTKDQEFADRLYADLQAKGVRCWFAAHQMKGGKTIHEQIDEAIRLHDRVLLILSRASMRSDWVNMEIATARTREKKEKRRVLFPVGLVSFKAIKEWKSIDADLGTDSARAIRECFIPDFSGWKDDHNAYKREFEGLLEALKAEPSNAGKYSRDVRRK